MKKLKYIFILLTGLAIASCVEDTAPEDEFSAGANLASFVNSATNLTVVATGEEFVNEIPMVLKGPSTGSVSSTVTATISVDPSSTAVEGLHYRLDQTTVQLSPTNDLIGVLPVTVLTDGIQPPLDETPVLVLNISSVSGAGNVIANGRKITLNLLYLCDSQLQGEYTVSITRTGAAPNGPYVYDETIAKTGDGQYRGLSVAHYAPESLGVGTPGFDFVDVCNQITVPEQNLVDYYTNLVYGFGESSVDPVTGVMTIRYTVTFAAGNRDYTAVYTPK